MATITPTVRRSPARGLGLSSQTLGVVAVISVLLSIAAVTATPFLAEPVFLARPVLPWWAVTCGYLLTETFVLHIQIRREAHTLSLSELPLVLGLFLSAPHDLLLGRLVASTVVFVLVRRLRPMKCAFNLAVGLAEVSLALAVFHLVATVPGTPGPITWVAAYAAGGAAATLSAFAVGAVIAMHEGDGRLGLLGLLKTGIGQPAQAVAVTAALVAVTSLSASLNSAAAPPGLRAADTGELPRLRVTRRAAPEPRAPLPLQPGGEQRAGDRRRHAQRPGRGEAAVAVRAGVGRASSPPTAASSPAPAWTRATG